MSEWGQTTTLAPFPDQVANAIESGHSVARSPGLSVKTLADMSTAPAQPDLFAFARPEAAKEMMAGAGLGMAAHEVVTPAWEMDQPTELFEIFLTATVGAAMLIKSQTPEVIDAIRDRVTETVAEKFAAGSGYRVPVPVAVVTAVPA